MLYVSTVEAREQLAELVNQASYGKERVIIKRHGRGVAAIVSLDDLKLLQTLEDATDIKEALIAREEIEQTGGIRWGDLKQEK